MDLRTVADLLGHRTLRMVMRYMHLADKHQAATVEKLMDGREKKYIKSDTESSRVDNRKWA
jgi:integrase